MKINQITNVSFINKQLKKMVGYFANGQTLPLFQGADITNGFNPKLLIVARKHYVIKQKSYPALNLAELKSLLKINQQSNSDLKSLTDIKVNKEIDGFDVKTITFDIQNNELLKGAWLLIPETELLEQTSNNKSIYELSTPAGVLFFSQSELSTNSAYCAGLINSISTYKHSVGIADDITPLTISADNYLTFLATQLQQLNLPELPKISLFIYQNKLTVWQLHALYWGPLLSVSVYFMLANAWQMYNIQSTEQAINNQNQTVNQVLENKRQLDVLNNKVNLFNMHVTNNPSVLADWEIVNIAIDSGMEIKRFSFKNGKVSLSGSGPSANTVITAIAQLAQVESAIFSGGVRKSRGQERFEIDIILKPKTKVES